MSVLEFTIKNITLTVEESIYNERGFYAEFLIKRKNHAVGTVKCYPDAMIAYGIDEAYRGNNIVPSIVNHIIKTYKEKYNRPLWLAISNKNKSSERVAEKCGFYRKEVDGWLSRWEYQEA